MKVDRFVCKCSINFHRLQSPHLKLAALLLWTVGTTASAPLLGQNKDLPPTPDISCPSKADERNQPNSATFYVDHLSIIQSGATSFDPVYRRDHLGHTLRFKIDAQDLVLIVSGSIFQRVQHDCTLQQDLVDLLPPDLLKIWFDDAQHWLKWLGGWEDQWSRS